MIKKIAGIAAVLLLILVIGISISRANPLVSQVEVLDRQTLGLSALSLNHLGNHYDNSLTAGLHQRSQRVLLGYNHLSLDGGLSNLAAVHDATLVDVYPSVGVGDLLLSDLRV